MSPTELEVTIRKQFEAGDLHAAATLAINGYGREVCGVATA